MKEEIREIEPLKGGSSETSAQKNERRKWRKQRKRGRYESLPLNKNSTTEHNTNLKGRRTKNAVLRTQERGSKNRTSERQKIVERKEDFTFAEIAGGTKPRANPQICTEMGGKGAK